MKFVKVMFLHMCVCAQRGACMAGGHAWQGAWQGVHGRGHTWWGHAWGACMVGGVHGRGTGARGHAWWGGVHGRGACVAGDMHATADTMGYGQ